MQSGDILLFKAEKTFTAKIIAWGTGSMYTHVAVCVSDAVNLAIEAVPGGGVRARDTRSIQTSYDIFRVKETFIFNRDSTISFLVSNLNRRYDFFGVLYLGLLKVLASIKLPLRNAANKWQKGRDYFCSELCYEAFYYGGGLDIVPEIVEADITSPGDIAASSILERVLPAGHTQKERGDE